MFGSLKIMLIILFSITFVYSNKYETLKLIYENRKYLNNGLQLPGNKFEKYTQPEDFKIWKKNEEDILYWFMYYVYYFNSNYPQDALVEDDVVISILLMNTKSGFIGQAHTGLLKFTSFESLRRNSDMIRKILPESKITDYEKNELMGFIHLTSEERIQLLEDKKTPLYIKARLGSRAAIDSLKKKFTTSTKYEKKEEYAIGLIRTELPECIKFTIKHFNDTIYKYNFLGCREESISYPILRELKRVHPDEPLLNITFFELLDLPWGYEEIEETKVVFKDYLEKVIAWFDKTYGVIPEKPIPNPIIKNRCIVY